MIFFETWSTRKRPRSRRISPKYLQLQLHGIRLLLTAQKTCSYLLEFAHIRLGKEFADILKPQHLSRYKSFLYFFPNISCQNPLLKVIADLRHLLNTTHLGKQAINKSGPHKSNPGRSSLASVCMDTHLLSFLKDNHHVQDGYILQETPLEMERGVTTTHVPNKSRRFQ